MWCRAGTSGGQIWTQQWTFVFHKQLGNLLAEELQLLRKSPAAWKWLARQQNCRRRSAFCVWWVGNTTFVRECDFLFHFYQVELMVKCDVFGVCHWGAVWIILSTNSVNMRSYRSLRVSGCSHFDIEYVLVMYFFSEVCVRYSCIQY
jgi:hypothetical protein